jgi:hypothetical protein
MHARTSCPVYNITIFKLYAGFAAKQLWHLTIYGYSYAQTVNYVTIFYSIRERRQPISNTAALSILWINKYHNS